MLSFPLLAQITNHPIWKITTLSVTLFAILWGCVQVNNLIMDTIYDYQQVLVHVNQKDLGGDLQNHNIDFWNEYFSIKQPFVPYIGHRSTSYEGEYVNVNKDRLRKTVALADFDDPVGELTIHFYGGSALWGYGARDEYTIPSLISQIMHDNHRYNINAINFADIGYNSLQDKTIFDIQLLKGNIPDIAIFYQGYNDISLGSIKKSYIGASSNALSIASIPLPDVDSVYNFYTRYIQSINATASVHDVEVVIIWQPTWVYKPLTIYEERVILSPRQSHSSTVQDYYLTLDPKLERFTSEFNIDHFLLYSDFFEETTETVFIDTVHITEAGNGQIASAITDYLVENILD